MLVDYFLLALIRPFFSGTLKLDPHNPIESQYAHAKCPPPGEKTMSHKSHDSFHCKDHIQVGSKKFHYYSLKKAAENGLGKIDHLPMTLKILLENLLRFEDNNTVKKEDIKELADWTKLKHSDREIAYRPARVLMQDFTGVPAVVDLAAMRDAMVKLGHDPKKINPLSPVDLVIDHSVQVDDFGHADAFKTNVALEMERNFERYAFLRWGQKAFDNFRVVPPGTGICHQVNLEYLAKVVWSREINGEWFAYPDTLVGTDSHTTMINGLGVLGWGVGGIEAEAAMLGQPVSMLIPEVIGFKLKGRLPEGVTATDLVLTVTQMLRKKGVVGKFVEFFGDGLDHLPLANRATIGNMSPEFGATCGFFPVDQHTLDYLQLSGRSQETIDLVKAYCQAQGLWRDSKHEPVFTDVLELNLADVKPSMAGPKRPQDRVTLDQLPQAMKEALEQWKTHQPKSNDELDNASVVIAAITSCTNTSNPDVLIGAGLLAKNAIAKGLKVKPWVKTSLAPGSKVVTEYLKKTGLQKSLDQLGFELVGYGCTTCIGNSGPLPDEIAEKINKNNLAVSAVLSGNRNFEGRIHPQVKANWLASPPLVVAFALAGTTNIDLTKEPLGKGSDGKPVYLKDIWPSDEEIAHLVQTITRDMFQKEYESVFYGDDQWRGINVTESQTYNWNNQSTYVQNPPYFQGMTMQPAALNDIKSARVLALLGDSITTDHISPAGSIKEDSPAGKYLKAHGVVYKDFNSYGARRGNHEVMMRGTFANIRIRNEMTPEKEGGYTRLQPNGDVMTIYDAAMEYLKHKTPLVVIAGKEYGTGSSRDWAAKGPALMGVKAVIAESFERIHRSNLIGMGIVPLEFIDGQNRKTLDFTGAEEITILGINNLTPRAEMTVQVRRPDGRTDEFTARCRIDTQNELDYYRNGGILQYVLRQL